jgi:hypothetical protein
MSLKPGQRTLMLLPCLLHAVCEHWLNMEIKWKLSFQQWHTAHHFNCFQPGNCFTWSSFRTFHGHLYYRVHQSINKYQISISSKLSPKMWCQSVIQMQSWYDKWITVCQMLHWREENRPQDEDLTVRRIGILFRERFTQKNTKLTARKSQVLLRNDLN